MARGNSTSGLSLQELQRMLDRRRRDVAKLQKQRAKVQKRLDAIDAKIDAAGGSVGGRSVTGRTRPRNEMSLQDTIHHILSKSGAPMSVGAVHDKVLASGYRSSAENFRGIVNQTLIKDKRFTTAGRGVYQLKK